jgi:hypothetical protein
MAIEIQNITPKELVYGVYQGTRLIHIGEGASEQRPLGYLQDCGGGAEGFTAKKIEITPEVRSQLALPLALQAIVQFRGNLDRLLQAAHCWQFGTLPQEDNLRGGKGEDSKCTGGFVRSPEVLSQVFALLEQFLKPLCLVHPWPTDFPAALADSIAPGPSLTKPQTRLRYLAFWFDLEQGNAFLGYTPLANEKKKPQPHYNAGTTQLEWVAERPSAASLRLS